MNQKLCSTVLFAALASAACLATDPLDQWQWRDPLPNGNVLHAAVFAGGQFVAVGNGGTVATSPDGFNWKYHSIGPIYGADAGYVLYGLAYGNGRLVAVGYGFSLQGGFGVILTSTDGVQWTPQACPSDIVHLNTVVYGGGGFVAGGRVGGHAGAILISPDGVAWSEQEPAGWSEVKGLAYGDGTYVAVTDFAGFYCSTQPAAGWEVVGWDGLPGAYPHLLSVAYGAGRFVAVGMDPRSPIVSPDGCTWTNWPPFAREILLWSVAFGDSQFVAVGPSGLVVVSSDGSNWVKRASGAATDLRALAYGNGTWVMLGDGTMLATTNLTSFQDADSTLTSRGIAGLAYGDGRFVAGGLQEVLTSPDGTNWTGQPSANISIVKSLAYGSGLFVAADEGGYLLSSPDGVQWTRRASVPPVPNAVTYAAGQFVAVTSSGTVLTSPNGVSWRSEDPGYGNQLSDIAYGAGTFVAVGDYGTVLSSPDAMGWTFRNSGTDATLKGVAYGDGQFVAVGYGAILTSSDGVGWAPARATTKAILYGIAFGHGTFVAVGAPGAVLTSTNGQDWAARESGTMNKLLGAAYGQGTFVAVGDTGTILQSGQFPLAGVSLGPLTVGADGTASFDAAGPANETWTIQASSDLANWTFLAEAPGTNTAVQILDSDAPNYRQRFYRGWAW